MTLQAPSPPAGIYIHWPFCERICPYCDFYKVGQGDLLFERQEDYGKALVAEIESAPQRFGWGGSPPEADTIYFGGGTPSLIGERSLGAVLDALGRVFTLMPRTEITLEVNPTSAEGAGANSLASLLALGVNRLSVGVQSLEDRVLGVLGRTHDAATARRAIEGMRRLGVTNLSLDLIFAVPGQSVEDLRRDVGALVALEPEHISAYGLTIHGGTEFGRLERQGRMHLPDEAIWAEMFETLIDQLAAAGYDHYEISNWARPGRESRHNQKYWRRCDVWAFGASAHGVERGRRFANRPSLEEYLKIDRRRTARPQSPPVSDRARCGEIMMLVLRRVEGIEWEEINDWMGRDGREFYRKELGELASDGFVACDDQRISLTRRGLLLADSVMERFF
jgi:oxygen-independent coproporphyrinogen-3 oxidase